MLMRFYPALFFFDRRRASIPTVAQSFGLYTNDKVPESQIYDILKIIFAELPALNKLVYFDYSTELELSASRIPIQYHPGARRFYQDNNYQTDLEKLHCIHYRTKCPKKPVTREMRIQEILSYFIPSNKAPALQNVEMDSVFQPMF